MVFFSLWQLKLLAKDSKDQELPSPIGTDQSIDHAKPASQSARQRNEPKLLDIEHFTGRFDKTDGSSKDNRRSSHDHLKVDAQLVGAVKKKIGKRPIQRDSDEVSAVSWQPPPSPYQAHQILKRKREVKR